MPVEVVFPQETRSLNLHVCNELRSAHCFNLCMLSEELLLDVLVEVVLALEARFEDSAQAIRNVGSFDQVPKK